LTVIVAPGQSCIYWRAACCAIGSKAVEPTSVSGPVAHGGDSLGEADPVVEGTDAGDEEFGKVRRWLEVVTAAKFVALPPPPDTKMAAAISVTAINAPLMADLFAFEPYCDIYRSCQDT
jgi:hypothetical protein